MNVKTCMLEAHDLRFVVNGATILDGVGVRVEPGQILGLVGPNGAGKTTLMRILAGLLRPSKGQVLLEGRPLQEYKDRERARIMAFVSQSASISFGFTAEEVVAMGRYPHKGRLAPHSARDSEVIHEAMKATGTEELARRRMHQLSGGEQQRVWIARALAQEPRLIFLDEPTSNLDVRFQLDILDLVSRLAKERGLAVVMAIHDLTWALRTCTHVLALSKGIPIAQGPADEVLTEGLVRRIFHVEAVRSKGLGGAPRIEFVGPLNAEGEGASWDSTSSSGA